MFVQPVAVEKQEIFKVLSVCL